jgi:Tol biopolymer transport system component
LFGAAVATDGTAQKGTNLYLYTPASVRQLTSYAADSNLAGVTSVAYAGGMACYAATPGGTGGAEEVHLLDIARAADRTLAVDRVGCIQPLCLGCYRPCVGPVHLSPDGTKVLYAVSQSQPFFVVNADGTGLTRLPVYLGALAPSPQRVISRNGVVVFTSSAPNGPTFAAAATDVYTINLDGSGLKQVTKFVNPSFFANNATISADGSVIAFESNFSESGPELASQIWTVRTDGTGLQRLSKGPDSAGNPSISGDGAVVAYRQSGQIMRGTTSGSAIRPLTRLSVSAPRFPAISEDGAQVAFALGPQNGEPAAVYWIPMDSPETCAASTASTRRAS